MLKIILVKDLKGTVNLILKGFQLGKNIVVKVGSIILILCLTSCSKDITLDPATTVGNQVIKVMMRGNDEKK
nr:hypothetical protein [uncultured Mediterranean phage uvMED]BAR38407.1 hypothetical protein [uncultured Mediterranean phage uvMED]